MWIASLLPPHCRVGIETHLIWTEQNSSLYQAAFTIWLVEQQLLRPMGKCFGISYMTLYKVRHSTKKNHFLVASYKGALGTGSWKIRGCPFLSWQPFSSKAEFYMSPRGPHPTPWQAASSLWAQSLHILSLLFAFSEFVSLCLLNPYSSFQNYPQRFTSGIIFFGNLWPLRPKLLQLSFLMFFEHLLYISNTDFI